MIRKKCRTASSNYYSEKVNRYYLLKASAKCSPSFLISFLNQKNIFISLPRSSLLLRFRSMPGKRGFIHLKMRKFKRREKERIEALNELVTDAADLYNECVQQQVSYRAEAADMLWYIELHCLLSMNERDYRDYCSLRSELQRIDHIVDSVQAEIARLETQFAQFNRQYTRLINHLERASDKTMRKIFADMEELALDLQIRAYNAKLDADLRYSLFYDFRQKMRAILFN
jgi:hypothetical protein